MEAVISSVPSPTVPAVSHTHTSSLGSSPAHRHTRGETVLELVPAVESHQSSTESAEAEDVQPRLRSEQASRVLNVVVAGVALGA